MFFLSEYRLLPVIYLVIFFNSQDNSSLLFEKLAPSGPSSAIKVVDNKMTETFNW